MGIFMRRSRRLATLRTAIRSRKTGRLLRLVRWVPTRTGVRGYYTGTDGELAAIDRDGVHRLVGKSPTQWVFE